MISGYYWARKPTWVSWEPVEVYSDSHGSAVWAFGNEHQYRLDEFEFGAKIEMPTTIEQRADR